MSLALVTGATGFIGSHLVRHLVAERWDVVVLHPEHSRSQDRLRQLRDLGVDVRTYSEFNELTELARRIDPDVAFHLATRYVRDHQPSDIDSLMDANISLGTHLLEGLVDGDCVIVSTMSYFQFLGGVPAPFSLYSATKQAFLDVSDYFRTRRGMDVRDVILYDTYGPDDTRDKLIPNTVAAIQASRPLVLGSKDQPINLLYVADVAAGLVAAARPGNPSTMCLRARSNTTVGAVIDELKHIIGRDTQTDFDGTRGVNNLVNEAGDWPTPQGWVEAWGISSGLRETVNPGATASG